MGFEDAQARLRSAKGSIRCDEVVTILQSLGFIVEPGTKGKHHTYVHCAIEGIASNFACPHRGGDPVKNNYITKILSVLRLHENALREFLGETR